MNYIFVHLLDNKMLIFSSLAYWYYFTALMEWKYS